MTTLLEQIVWNMTRLHPLPWSVEYDWCEEVYDAHHHLIIKLMFGACEMIALAERLAMEYTGAAVEIERMLNEPEV